MFLWSNLRQFWLLILCKSLLCLCLGEIVSIFLSPGFWNFTMTCLSGDFCPSLSFSTQGTQSNWKLRSFSSGKIFHFTYFNNFLPTISRSFLSKIRQSEGVECNGRYCFRQSDQGYVSLVKWHLSRNLNKYLFIYQRKKYYIFLLFLALSLFLVSLFFFFFIFFGLSLLSGSFAHVSNDLSWALTLRGKH